ncbi:MAG TPA: glycoside hydrolase family 3 protein [Thermoanaerobaculia bacterium]|nr:glycoside hydrolase family 3 protein [Thermoanaerobaculia bacterium]
MQLEDKVAQLFVVSNRDADVVRFVRDLHVGGLIWFAATTDEVATTTAQLQALAPEPLLVGADLEAGLGMRFTDVMWWPPAMAIAATGEPRYAFEMGRITALEARALGVHHVLAPVADVNTNRANPVINTRSFGEDPAVVSEYVAAFTRGVQSAGALACAKHFPGHGDTRVDSHIALPATDRYELAPFRAAIAADVASIMVGHLAVPSLDPSSLPATLSKPIIDLLRREYDGLIVSDAFDMGGITNQFDAGEAAVRGIEAGLDQILCSPDPDAAIAAVVEAVRRGRIRIDEPLERVMAAKRRVDRTPVPREVVDAAEHRALAEEIARRAVHVERDERGLLPLRASDIAAVVVSDWPEENQLVDAVRLLQPNRVYTADATTPSLDVDAEVILLLLALRAKSYAGRIALPDAARELAQKRGAKTIAIAFGSPYLMDDLPQVSTFLNAYGIQPVLQRAAIDLLRK